MMIAATRVVRLDPWDHVCEIDQFGTKILIDLALPS